jgi:hypothetical protein
MKLFFLTSGLLATTFACPWLICQEPALKPGLPSLETTSALPLVTSPSSVQVQGQQQGAAIDTTVAPAPGYPDLALPPAYTERRQYEYDWSAAPAESNELSVVRYQQVPSMQERQAFAKAYAAYQAAKDDVEARSKAVEDLKTGLGKQYDSFIEGQAKQIAELEERLANLKEKLDKRRAAKERMVELKLQMVLSQAEGLGFPDAGPPNAAFFYGDVGTTIVPAVVPQYPDPNSYQKLPHRNNVLPPSDPISPLAPAAPAAPAQRAPRDPFSADDGGND